MFLIVLAIIGLAAFLGFIAYLNGGSSPFRHIDTPSSWPTGSAPGEDDPLGR